MKRDKEDTSMSWKERNDLKDWVLELLENDSRGIEYDSLEEAVESARKRVGIDDDSLKQYEWEEYEEATSNSLYAKVGTSLYKINFLYSLNQEPIHMETQITYIGEEEDLQELIALAKKLHKKRIKRIGKLIIPVRLK